MPRGAGLATSRLDVVREARSKLIAPASDRFLTDDNPALEQQFFDITKAELKPEIPANRATDDRAWEAMTVIKRFCILHCPILRDRPGNVTMPSRLLHFGIYLCPKRGSRPSHQSRFLLVALYRQP